MLFDRFRKKKEDLPTNIENVELPEDLERFRLKPPETKPEAIPEVKPDYPELNYGKSVEELVAERVEGNKIELILQKLETIDARLRLIEEKLKRY
ncbi:MAG: hypothetical protein QXD43_02415 [Candidatus Aenigmatarchaeota archaeon]